MKVSLADRFTPNDEVLFQEVGGEAVLLNLGSESYFGLDPVGTRFWVLLNNGATLQAAYEAMLEEYDVQPAQLEQDLLELAAKLLESGLVVRG